MKIVSLLPSATELVYELGLGDRLAGVTFECDHPAEARAKPVVSTTTLPFDGPASQGAIDTAVRERMGQREPLYALDKGLISSIQPDVILTQDLCRVCAIPSGQVEDALDELGCRAEVVSMDPKNLDEILASFLAVGRATGAGDRAGEVVDGLRARIEAVRAKTEGLTRKRAVAIEWLDPPFVGGHWIPEMVELAGGESLLARPGDRSRTVTWSDVAAAAPEVIVYMPCGFGLERAEQGAAELLARPELHDTPALASGAVFATDASSYFSRPGPRIVDGLEILGWAIHPDAFPEPPAGTVRRIPVS